VSSIFFSQIDSFCLVFVVVSGKMELEMAIPSRGTGLKTVQEILKDMMAVNGSQFVPLGK